jgi:hypothetical protein
MKQLVICLCLLIPISVIADEFPKRKPGLWEIQTLVEGQTEGTTTRQCIDKESDAKLVRMQKEMDAKKRRTCTKNEFRKEDKRFVHESDCTMDGVRVISKTVFSGDFNSKYSAEITTKFGDADKGLTGQNAVMNARWLGPCEPDQKPGDVIISDSLKMNIITLEVSGEKAKK